MRQHRQIEDIDSYYKLELGARYSSSGVEADTDIERPAAELCAALGRDGYVIIEDVIPRAECEAIKAEMNALFEHDAGRNNFEGFRTQRLYALIEKTLRCNPWIELPQALGLVEHALGPNSLLSQAQIINILPGEAAQPWHVDDGFYPWPRPRPPLGAATIFALDEFTDDNGATVVIPGSHRWDEKRPADEDKARAIKAVMPQGSMLFFLGTTWHHGGENESNVPRMCLTAQYCAPWCRQQENYSLSISRDTVRQCSPRIRQLLGYSIHRPFMGMVNGKHPLRLLEDMTG